MADPLTPSSSSSVSVTPRTTLKRHPERGSHDRALVNAILDEALVCHVGVVVDGAPRVLPTAHARVGDVVYMHGARANRIFGAVASGAPACVTVTLLDGIVFARTWFHHSMNYRCAVLHGAGSEVTAPDEKLAALAALVDKAAPGRTRESREPTPAELTSTLVVRFPVDEASAKVRVGPPLDSPEQLADDTWAGVLPLRLAALPAQDDVQLRDGIAPSAVVEDRARTLPPGAEPPYEQTRDGYTVSTDPRRIDFALVARFLAEDSYWARGMDVHHHRLALGHSVCFGLYGDGGQLGFARVMTDYGRFALLADVFVTPAARGKGLGKWLVSCVLEHPELAKVPRWMLGTADAHGLYERFGFVRAEPGRFMIRTR
jgi:nitroimidazol reductase NimA-like FMN-containing flavoprotein (pyridoxamine 5'-phosphate oxidase superfamily)/GNAT superfamily N-acetyltransferase